MTRTETNSLEREDRAFSTKDVKENQAMSDDEFYFKRIPSKYGYRDMKKYLFA